MFSGKTLLHCLVTQEEYDSIGTNELLGKSNNVNREKENGGENQHLYNICKLYFILQNLFLAFFVVSTELLQLFLKKMVKIIKTGCCVDLL